MLVSLIVTVVAGALLTRRSLEMEAVRTLERQAELVAAERAGSAADGSPLGRFLATEQHRLAILTAAQAELLLPAADAAQLRQDATASGSVEVRGADFLFAARRDGEETIVLLRPRSLQETDWEPSAVGLALAGLVGAVLAGVVAFLAARAVARPLARVAEASAELAVGDTPEPLPVAGPREVRRLAGSFNHLAGELERSRDAEQAFLLSVSHELKTPLTSIRGHAEALEDGVFDPAAGGAVIGREAGRLERLVGDLLDLGRVRRPSFSTRAEPVDLGAIALAAFERHEHDGRSFGVALHLLVEPGALATGDADRVLQIVSNLVENALRATPRGGAVRIVAGPGRIEVVDDGPGLVPDELPRAFDRFYLYERGERERRVGTGLGLAIVRELAEAMGGSVTVRSEIGVGSAFTVLLPAASSAPDPARAAAAGTVDERADGAGPRPAVVRAAGR